ncbi:MAG: hypothetical protein JST54_17185 [Deltaproteobacteria bacterium]|nr:hypothetical protein [Deltaproteobacteria bacterium]
MFAHVLAGLLLTASVVPQTVEQLTDRATHVVHAKVTRVVSAREPGPSGIYTRSTLNVSEWLKGPALKSVSLRQSGGTIGSESVELPGDAIFHEGEEVLAFLRCDAGADHCSLVGLAQGKYQLTRDANGKLQATRDFHETAFVKGAPLSGGPEPFDALAARVRARVGGGK